MGLYLLRNIKEKEASTMTRMNMNAISNKEVLCPLGISL